MQYTLLALFAAAASAARFNGQLRIDNVCSEGCNPNINLVDYNTGSRYYCGVAYPDFCDNPTKCKLGCTEDKHDGGYSFDINFWQTKDGCDNVDFHGAFGGAGHEYCCGGAPCDIK